MRVDKDEMYRGYFGEIENTLKAKQKYVGGIIQVIHLTPEIDVICNDDGKLLRLPLNRLWIENDRPLDVFAGNIMCVRHCAGEFTSILESDREVIEERLLPYAGTLGRTFLLYKEETLPEFKE